MYKSPRTQTMGVGLSITTWHCDTCSHHNLIDFSSTCNKTTSFLSCMHTLRPIQGNFRFLIEYFGEASPGSECFTGGPPVPFIHGKNILFPMYSVIMIGCKINLF